MQTTDFNNKLGAGIYSIPDVAFILKLPVPKVRRWMNEFWNSRMAQHDNKYSWGEGLEKATNFYTLIEFYVFYLLRESKVSTQKILIAHEDMSSQLNTPYPFASSKLLTDGRSILFTLSDGSIVKADRTRQSAFKEIIEKFCKKIEFSDSNIAERFYPLGRNRSIVVDPHHQFGQPIVSETNILAETIFDLYQAGENTRFISHLYQLKEKEVKDAIALFTSEAAA